MQKNLHPQELQYVVNWEFVWVKLTIKKRNVGRRLGLIHQLLIRWRQFLMWACSWSFQVQVYHFDILIKYYEFWKMILKQLLLTLD